MNLRHLAESDLAKTVEDPDGFGLPVVITKVDTPATTQSDLSGKVVYAYEDIQEDIPVPVVIQQPLVTLRISSLTVIPGDGENWYFDIPSSSVDGAPVERYVFTKDAARRGSLSIGFYSYPLVKYTDNRP